MLFSTVWVSVCLHFLNSRFAGLSALNTYSFHTLHMTVSVSLLRRFSEGCVSASEIIVTRVSL